MQRHVTGTVPSGTRRRTAPRALLLVLVVLIAASPAHAQSQAPPDYKPQGYINDFANVLSQPTRDQRRSNGEPGDRGSDIRSQRGGTSV